jgi:hypothetical protein
MDPISNPKPRQVNSQLFWEPRYIAAAQTTQKTLLLLLLRMPVYFTVAQRRAQHGSTENTVAIVVCADHIENTSASIVA